MILGDPQKKGQLVIRITNLDYATNLEFMPGGENNKPLVDSLPLIPPAKV